MGRMLTVCPHRGAIHLWVSAVSLFTKQRFSLEIRQDTRRNHPQRDSLPFATGRYRPSADEDDADDDRVNVVISPKIIH